jgi:hypothetical protein
MWLRNSEPSWRDQLVNVFVFRNLKNSFTADVHLLEDTQTVPVPQNVVTSRFIAVSLGTSLSGYALLNASRTAANDFDAKLCSRMNTGSAREYTMFAPA